jgi:hypothetical protein
MTGCIKACPSRLLELPSGRRVDVYFFWWALERLLTDRLDEPDFPEREDVAAALRGRGASEPAFAARPSRGTQTR